MKPTSLQRIFLFFWSNHTDVTPKQNKGGIDLLNINIIFFLQYVRPGAAPIPGGAASVGGTSSGQVRPPANLGPLAGRGRGDWRPLGMRNASAAQKGFHQPWGSNTAGRGLDFTLPSHK